MNTFDACDRMRIDDMIKHFFAEIEAESLEWYGKCKSKQATEMRDAIIKGIYKKSLDNSKIK